MTELNCSNWAKKICKVEKNQRLVNHIMEFDAKGKEYDWYEQHIALIPKIVTCIECEYWGAYTDNGKPNGMGHCGHPNILMPTSENFFCGFCERKEKEND